MNTSIDVDKLANVLAAALVGAIDKGAKEDKGQDWEQIFAKGPAPYLSMGRKDLTGVPNAVYAHGPGGIFSTAGIENLIVNAHMTPLDLDPLLQAYPTVFMNPLFPVLTGFSEGNGDEPNGVCEDCLGGTMQGGTLTAVFGHICRGSDEIHIMRTIQMINRGETAPLTLLGDILGPGGISKMPNTPTEWIEVVTRAEMVKIAVLLQRKITKMTWGGNPANNSLGGGYKEFPGLEMLVGSGKIDAISGVALPSLDSLVMDFGDNDVSASVGGHDIVSYLSTMEWYMRHNASRMGLDPVSWVLAIRPELWFELSAIWPCRYLTDRCSAATDAVVAGVVLNDNTAIQMRDQMRNSMTITINGRVYPVVTCDGLTEEHGDAGLANFNANLFSGQYASSIFFLPLKVRGGMNTLYWEHLDYSKADPEIAQTRSQNDFWTDGGRFFWTVERKRGCYKMNAEIDLRLILRTPHLAARLDGIAYSPLKHLRSPFYGDPYFLKGGVSVRSAPEYYAEWRPVGPT